MRALSELNKEIKADTRIQLAKIGGLIALVASIVLTISSSVSGAYASYSMLAYLGFYIVSFSGFVVLRKDSSALLLYAVLSSYIWVAYVLKFSLVLFEPELALGLGYSPSDAQSYFRLAVPRFLVLSPALMLFVIGLWFGPVMKTDLMDENTRVPGTVNFGFFYLSILGILILKLVGQVFFDVGSPIRFGHGLPPLILALYELVVQDAIIVLLNVLFFTLLYLRLKRGIIIASAALVANVILALSAGWKSAMVLQALTLAYLFFELRNRVSTKAKRRILIFSALFVGLMLVVYPYVNYYRFASSQGVDIQTAISKARKSVETDGRREQGSDSFGILDRIGGIGTYISIIGMGENKNFPLTSLWGNDFGNMVKYELYGAAADDVMVQFSATQFAALFLVGGWAGLYVGSFLMGMFFRIITSLLANRAFKYATTFHAYLPLLCFSWLSFLMGGGKLGIILKELLVVVVSAMILERLVFRKKQAPKLQQGRGPSDDNNIMQPRVLRHRSKADVRSDGTL